MKQSYLEITFRRGRFLGAYLYLPRGQCDRVARSEKRNGGLVVDFAADGRPIGIEITSDKGVSLADINDVTGSVHQTVEAEDLAPLCAVA